jgi:hypothetical protein
MILAMNMIQHLSEFFIASKLLETLNGEHVVLLMITKEYENELLKTIYKTIPQNSNETSYINNYESNDLRDALCFPVNYNSMEKSSRNYTENIIKIVGCSNIINHLYYSPKCKQFTAKSRNV